MLSFSLWLSGALAHAGPPPAPVPIQDLRDWGVALTGWAGAPDTCRTAALGAHLLIVCPGAALVVAPDDGTTMVELIDTQVTPFHRAGMPIGEPSFVPCLVASEPAECVALTIDMGLPGARMTLLAGEAADGSWAGLCMSRPSAQVDPCEGVIDPAPDIKD